MLCDDLEGWDWGGGGGKAQEGGNICILMADPRCCTAETNITIILQLKIKKKKRTRLRWELLTCIYFTSGGEPSPVRCHQMRHCEPQTGQGQSLVLGRACLDSMRETDGNRRKGSLPSGAAQRARPSHVLPANDRGHPLPHLGQASSHP